MEGTPACVKSTCGRYTRTNIKVLPEVHVNKVVDVNKINLWKNLDRILLRDVSVDEEGEWPLHSTVECGAYLICNPLPKHLDDNLYTKLTSYSTSKTKKYSEMIDAKPKPEEFVEK